MRFQIHLFINVGAPTKDTADVPCEQFITKCCPNTMFLSPTDQSEILEIIFSLKDSCAAGADGIKPKPLKAVAEGLSVPLVHICNLILSQGVFPEKMKLARVTAIHKGGPTNNLNNYRPISVLSVFAKIAERIINKRLTAFLSLNNILIAEQFGFQKKKSTEVALLGIKEQILENIEMKVLTLGIFLDLRKAFDSVQHEVLLRKLSYYGVRGVA